MKKIINGRVYDNETADAVGSWSSSINMSDFSYTREVLFRKKNGEFFLDCEGGPRSPYARCYAQNSWGYGEQITPISDDAARQWAEEHLSGEEYEEIFGIVEDDDGDHVFLSASLSSDAEKLIRQLSKDAGMSIGSYIEYLMQHAE